METNKLYNLAEKQGITVDFFDLEQNPAVSLMLGNKGFIAMSKKLCSGSAKERVALAHEIGHHAAGAFYTAEASAAQRGKKERLADRFAIELLVPYRELMSAAADGDQSVSFLAERFEVTEDFMRKAIKYYTEKTA